MNAKNVVQLRRPKRVVDAAVVRRLQEIGNLPDIDAKWAVVKRAFINQIVRDAVAPQTKGAEKKLLKDIAKRAGVGQQTVSRLAHYETTRPHDHTMMAVIFALDAFDAYTQQVVRFNEKLKRGGK